QPVAAANALVRLEQLGAHERLQHLREQLRWNVVRLRKLPRRDRTAIGMRGQMPRPEQCVIRLFREPQHLWITGGISDRTSPFYTETGRMGNVRPKVVARGFYF